MRLQHNSKEISTCTKEPFSGKHKLPWESRTDGELQRAYIGHRTNAPCVRSRLEDVTSAMLAAIIYIDNIDDQHLTPTSLIHHHHHHHRSPHLSCSLQTSCR
ncbi:hypothetical protein AYI69_g3043 [Smittium culicis]|uniref:Uncharacterized protein n=1 Tax=Smittium culicis TaxID=133412 RepID=A0A1R1YKS4_9FUNG|nr:hypothetical protein AYI69_g3043 [Smittium culicis]